MTKQEFSNPEKPAQNIGKYLYCIIVAIIFIATLLSTWYIPLSIILFVVTVLMLLDRLGKGIVLRELIAAHSLFVCVFMPVIGYLIYNKNNLLARVWVKSMPISEEQYFSYALPAMCLFILALCWPVTGKASDQGKEMGETLNRARRILNERPKIGFYIMIIGLVTFLVSPYLPAALQFVGTLIFWSSFAGALYLYFSETAKRKRLIFLAFIIFILANAIRSGMFTIVVYMGITLFSFFYLGKKVAFWKKFATLIVCIFTLILIQSVKQSYRTLTWRQGYEGDKFLLFGSLLVDKWNSTSSFFEQDAFFPVYYRTNQGYNVSLVMQRFPKIKPYDNGKNLGRTVAASLVPRLFWPDKPEAGGKENMKYYANINLRGWSTNVGPLGEAYGSFGPTGGIFYMLFLGGLIRWAYRRIFIITEKVPLLFFWIPVFFYQVTYSAESDTLQILNSLIKSVFFVWLLVKLFPDWFGISRNQYRYNPVEPPERVGAIQS